MKIIIIRHGDPDYTIDSLTEKGWKEAEYLVDLVSGWDVKEFYVSPLGRARDTASFTLKALNREAIECKWLREFQAPLKKDMTSANDVVTWDWLPAEWTPDDNYYNIDTWLNSDKMKEFEVAKEYKWVIDSFDELLEKHGYKRNGRIYDAVNPNNDTIVFFCHFGLECVLLSHLLNISPMLLWHGTAAAPTSVTTVVTEERREGVASWRMLSFGETTHLYIKNEAPSFSARFRECYTNEEERLD